MFKLLTKLLNQVVRFHEFPRDFIEFINKVFGETNWSLLCIIMKFFNIVCNLIIFIYMYYLILSVENAVSQNGKPYQILNLVAPSLFTILPTDQGSTPQDSDQGSNQPGSTLSGSTPQSFQYLSFPDFVQPLVSFKAYLWNSTVPSDAVSKFVFVPSTYFSNSKGFINLTLSSSPQFYPLDHFVSRSGYSQLQQFYFTYFKPIPSYQEFSLLFRVFNLKTLLTLS